MRVALRNRMTQDATVFKKSGNDGFGGYKYDNGTNIKCRWESSNDLFRDSNGNEFVAKSVVYPDRFIDLSCKIALGKNKDIIDSHEVRFTGQSPSMNNTKVTYKVAL